MPDHATKRGARLGLIAFGTLGVVGIGMILLAERDAPRQPTGPSVSSRGAGDIETYRAHLRPARAEETRRGAAAVARLRDSVSALDAVVAGGTTRRIVRSGHVLDARFRVEVKRTEDGAVASLSVERGGAAGARYELSVANGRLTPPTWAAQGRGGALGAATGPVPPSELAPFSIGDLSVSDLVALLDALLRDAVHVAGALDGLGSTRQLVLRARLLDGGGNPAEESPFAGSEALVYLEAERLSPVSLRVFARDGALVREIGDIRMVPAAQPGRRPQAFRADSHPAGSRTAFAVEDWETRVRASRRGAP